MGTSRRSRALRDDGRRGKGNAGEGPYGRTRVSSAAGGVLADAAGSVVIRHAVAADRDGIVRLAGVADAGDRLDTLLTDPCRCILVTEPGSEIVGLAEAQFYGTALRRAFGVVRFHDLVVDERDRRRGIGSALLDEVERWAMSIPECRYLEWQSSQSAVGFYEARADGQ